MRAAKKGMTLLFVLLLTLGSAVSAFAAEKVTLSLQMKIGSTSALVNGTKETIEKPFVQNGTTLVPLGVFQRAFGTSSRLEGEDVVRVSYGSRTVTFTIGSKSSSVNGKKVALDAAPVMKNGTLMVPMRPVTDMLGAEVKFSAGNLVVTLKSDKGIPGQVPAEEEKSADRVGSSYADWSIDSPAGATAEPNGSEFSTLFSDADGTYVLQVHVWDEGVDVPASDMREQLEQEADNSNETVIDSEIFPNAVVPYAHLITLDTDGIYWQERRYYKEGRVYSLYLGDSTAESYKDLKKWDSLLDSFQPTFATAGHKTEDISTVQNGLVPAAIPDYGVTLEVPVGWTPIDSEQREYQSEDGSVLKMDVVSADTTIKTLQDWHKLLQSRADEIFLPGIAQPIVSETTKAAGESASIEKLAYDLGGGVFHWNWLTVKKDNYLYVLRYSAPQNAYQEQTFRKIADSLDIDYEKVPSKFGKLGQISYLKDKSLNATFSTDDFRLSVPAYWSAQPIEGSKLDKSFMIPGGLFRIDTVETGLEASSARAVRELDEQKLDDATLTYETPKRTTFAGVPAIRIAYKAKGSNGNPYQAEDIYFRHGDVTYRIHHQLDQGAATPAQLSGIERALQSFAFLKPIMNNTK